MKKILTAVGVFSILSIYSSISFAESIGNISILDGVKTYVEIDSIEDNKSILDLKESIENKTNIPKEDMEIYLNNVKLDNTKSILNSKIQLGAKINLKTAKWNNLEVIRDNLVNQIKDMSINLDNIYTLQNNEVYVNNKKIISNLLLTINKIYVTNKHIYLFESQNILKYNINTYDKEETIVANSIEAGASILDIAVVEDKLVYLYNTGTTNTYIKRDNVKTSIDGNMNIFESLEYDSKLNKLYYITDNNIYSLDYDGNKTLVKNISEYILDCSIYNGNIYLVTTDGINTYLKDLGNNKNIDKFELSNSYTGIEYIALAVKEKGVYFSGSLGAKNIIGIFPNVQKSKVIKNGNIQVCADMISNTRLEVKDLGKNKYNIDCIREDNKSYIKLENCMLTFNNLKNTGKVRITGNGIDKIVNIKNGSASLKVNKLGMYKLEYIEDVLVNPDTGIANYPKEAIIFFFNLVKNIFN